MHATSVLSRDEMKPTLVEAVLPNWAAPADETAFETWSFAIGVVLMMLGLGLGVSEQLRLQIIQQGWKAQLQTFLPGWVDPFVLLQLAGAGCVAYLLALLYRTRTRKGRVKQTALMQWPKSLLVLCIVAAVFLSMNYAKAGFPYSNARPVIGASNQVLTDPVKRVLAALPGLGAADKLDAPSGYSARQTFLFLLFSLLALNRAVVSEIPARRRIPTLVILWGITIFSLVGVIVLRYALGAHTVSALAVGIGIGVIAFWLLEICLSIVAGERVGFQVGPFLAWAFMYFVIFMLHGGSIVFWGSTWLALLVLSGIVLLLEERKDDLDELPVA